MKKRILTMFAAYFCLTACFCSFGAAQAMENAGEAKPLAVIATAFPGYDFAREITGTDAGVRLLLPPGGESHSYEPTPQDIIAIQNADLLLTVGGESEHWLKAVLASMGDHAPRVFAMLDHVTALAEEQSLSMQAEEAHAHEGHTHEDGVCHHPEAMDEHVWTSPKNARLIVQGLTELLAEIQPAQESAYRANAGAYLAELDALDATLEETVQSGLRRKIIFGDRFPFRYFAHDYGLAYDAAFPGCSEDSEPSAQTVVSLIREISRENIPVVFYIEFSSRKTADILVEETRAKPLLMHSCHNVSAEELTNGTTYLSLMWANVAALKEALN